MEAARARGMDVLILDTAGRFHNKVNLMNEVEKIQRVLKKHTPSAPHEVLLVIDATTGQNALSQARAFHEKLGLTGLVITKLDGTAKGGMAIAFAQELKVPIVKIGVGEGIDDLQDFDPAAYVEAMFGELA
jgi:fused signal recognition particle receptor